MRRLAGGCDQFDAAEALGGDQAAAIILDDPVEAKSVPELPVVARQAHEAFCCKIGQPTPDARGSGADMAAVIEPAADNQSFRLEIQVEGSPPWFLVNPYLRKGITLLHQQRPGESVVVEDLREMIGQEVTIMGIFHRQRA